MRFPCGRARRELTLDDAPDIVVIQAYITSAYRSYRNRRSLQVARSSRRPRRPARHIAAGRSRRPRRHYFPRPRRGHLATISRRLPRGKPAKRYQSSNRTLDNVPPIRRDLIKRQLYLVPNSIVVSRGCPYVCDFCYKEAFFKGGRSFYTQTVDAALAEIDRLPGRHLYFLDDHLFGNARFAAALFDGMRGMGRLWQAAGTVKSVLQPGLLEKAVNCGLRSLFVGFETLNIANLREQRKMQNLRRDYSDADATPSWPGRDDQRQFRFRHGC